MEQNETLTINKDLSPQEQSERLIVIGSKFKDCNSPTRIRHIYIYLQNWAEAQERKVWINFFRCLVWLVASGGVVVVVVVQGKVECGSLEGVSSLVPDDPCSYGGAEACPWT